MLFKLSFLGILINFLFIVALQELRAPAHKQNLRVPCNCSLLPSLQEPGAPNAQEAGEGGGGGLGGLEGLESLQVRRQLGSTWLFFVIFDQGDAVYKLQV